MSREDVIRRLVRREQQQKSLLDRAVLNEDPELYRLACDHFGTWETALEYAGIEISAPAYGPKWNPEKVIAALQLRHQQGKPIKGLWRDDTSLARAAAHYFGSTKKAWLAARVEVEDDPRPCED